MAPERDSVIQSTFGTDNGHQINDSRCRQEVYIFEPYAGNHTVTDGERRGVKWLSMNRNNPTNEVVFLFCPTQFTRVRLTNTNYNLVLPDRVYMLRNIFHHATNNISIQLLDF